MMASKNPEGPNCFDCMYSRTLPWNTHLSCHCPAAQRRHAEPLLKAMGMKGKQSPPHIRKVCDISLEMVGLTADPHGVENGWALWPYNYDPVWLIGVCVAYTPEDLDD